MKDMRKVNEHREYVNDIADDCAREHSFDGLDVRAYNSCKYGFLEGYGRAEKDLGWVSVKERLPGPSEWVVACVEVDGICTCLTLATYNEETKEWHTDDWIDGEQEVYYPDYWMPIPIKVREGEKRQIKKDCALTISDLELLHTFLYAVKNNKQGCFTFTRLSDEQYEEVLRRFNEAKK